MGDDLTESVEALTKTLDGIDMAAILRNALRPRRVIAPDLGGMSERAGRLTGVRPAFDVEGLPRRSRPRPWTKDDYLTSESW